MATLAKRSICLARQPSKRDNALKREKVRAYMIAIIESRKFDSNVTTVLTTVHGMMLKMVLNKCSYKLRFTIPAQLSLIVGVEKSEQ